MQTRASVVGQQYSPDATSTLTTPPTVVDDGSKKLSKGGVAGIVIAVLIVVAALVVGGVWYRKRLAAEKYRVMWNSTVRDVSHTPAHTNTGTAAADARGLLTV